MSPIDPHDPRLTAYALDELPAEERAAFEPLLRDDPAARAAVDEIRRTAAALESAFAAEPLPARSVALPALHPRHWLVQLVVDSWTLWVPAGVVAAFALFFWRVYLPQHPQRAGLAVVATGPRPGGVPGIPVAIDDTGAADGAGDLSRFGGHLPRPAAPTGIESASTTLKPSHFLTARQNPTSQFPVNVGDGAYGAVRRSVEAGLRPATGLVRIEELVNHFAFRYPQPAAGQAVGVSTEMHAAPWAADHLLVRIGLQGRDAAQPATTGVLPDRPTVAARDVLTASAAAEIRAIAARDVKVQVDFNPERVLAYRLLGYENRLLKRSDAELAAADQNLGAGRSVTALYEIIPLPLPPAPAATAAKPAPPPLADPADPMEWLTVKLRYADPAVQQARTLVIPLHASDTAALPPASADFQFAAAVAGFGLILQDNPNKEKVSWELVEALAREGLVDDPSGQREEFVSLVRKARALGPAEAVPAAQ